MKHKRLIIISIIILIAITAIYLWTRNSLVDRNNEELKNSITSVTANTVQLNEILPFKWDIVYTFGPYASKEQIEKIVGIKSPYIKDNQINEGMVHLLFVSNGEVVASVLGYAENLGYRLDFSEKVYFTDDTTFNVSNMNGIIVLSHAK